MKARRPAAFEAEDHLHVALPRLVLHRRDRRAAASPIDRRDVVALQLGVEAARIGDVGDQPVEPLHVVLDHLEQARAAFRVCGERQRPRRPSAAR